MAIPERVLHLGYHHRAPLTCRSITTDPRASGNPGDGQTHDTGPRAWAAFSSSDTRQHTATSQAGHHTAHGSMEQERRRTPAARRLGDGEDPEAREGPERWVLRWVGPGHPLIGHRKRLPDRAEGHKAKSVPCTRQHGPEGQVLPDEEMPRASARTTAGGRYRASGNPGGRQFAQSNVTCTCFTCAMSPE
jgi:hypothetical protein